MWIRTEILLQIVCGAQRQSGDTLLCVGAVLETSRLKEVKLRGESCGMERSSRELGLGIDQSSV